MSRFASRSPADSSWSLDPVEHRYLEGVRWELYEHLHKFVGNCPLRITCDNGELEIMSPLPEHEDARPAIRTMVRALIEELDVPHRGLNSTTFRRRLKQKDLEPDNCYYIKSQPLIVGMKRINLSKGPPPDLRIPRRS